MFVPHYDFVVMDPADFRRHGHELVEWIAEYLEHPDRYPVLSRVKPGDIVAALPTAAPEEGEPFDAIMADFERVLVPGLTHWNHPGFFAYFAITGSAPGVLAEFLSAALNQQAMLWRTSPAATELEAVALGWLRQLIGLPDTFEGVIYDTASIATMHALVAARQAAVADVRARGLAGRPDVPPLRVYCSEQAHSSIDKSVDRHRPRPRGAAQDSGRCRVPHASGRAGGRDRRGSRRRHSADRRRRDRRHDVHDQRRSGAGDRRCLRARTALAARRRRVRRRRGHAAVARAHSATASSAPTRFVVNPHKWLFTPFDLSAFYCRRMDVVRAAFSLTPEFLRTAETGQVKNLMDTGVQLGRRFRALKLWMILRSFGARAIREHLAEHIRARADVCVVGGRASRLRTARAGPVQRRLLQMEARGTARCRRRELDAANERLLDRVNQTGEVFLSHTRLREGIALRLAIGHLQTTERHVRRAWELLVECSATGQPSALSP